MTTEKIYIGIDDQVIEATGEVKDALLAEIAAIKAKEVANAKAATDKAAEKTVIAKRLGLSDAELAILLG